MFWSPPCWGLHPPPDSGEAARTPPGTPVLQRARVIKPLALTTAEGFPGSAVLWLCLRKASGDSGAWQPL